MERTIQTPDGRELRVVRAGAPDGRPVVYQMGTPTSRLVFPAHAALALRLGIRLVSYDRPGYGASTPRPGRVVADSADDVEAIADALGLDRFGLWAFSGGPPFVLAVAARIPERVTGVVTLASPAPGYDERESDYDATREQLLRLTEDDWRAKLRPEYAAFAEFAVATLRIALAPGPEGWREDDAALCGDWGFDIAAIRAPVRLRHGRADKAVPVANGEWLAARIPHAEALFSEDDHQGVFFHYAEDDFAWLAAQASATA
jgi:pimeloyl-ACP methyl ester carboxylesterase